MCFNFLCLIPHALAVYMGSFSTPFDDNHVIHIWQHILLITDIRSSMKYGVTHISMKQSGGLPVAPLKQKAEGAVSSGSVAAIVFSIIIIIVVIGFAIFCFADRSKYVQISFL